MTSALLGYTGFVGTTLRGQTSFDALYNSSNIGDIEGASYDLVVCAAAPAAKWKANQNPEADWENLQRLMSHLRHVDVGWFILISTIDVYPVPVDVDEGTSIKVEQLAPYGKHRFYLEAFAQEQFPDHTVIRLPGLFGIGLRKNFLFDLIHQGSSEWTHCDSVFQFYNMMHLWRDIQIVYQHKIPLINFATEPVSAREVAQRSFGLDFTVQTTTSPVRYDMHSRHAHLFDSPTEYIATAEDTFTQIRAFVQIEKSLL